MQEHSKKRDEGGHYSHDQNCSILRCGVQKLLQRSTASGDRTSDLCSHYHRSMRLHPHTLANLAIMICGDNEPKIGKPFPYRSSSRLTAFFTNCDLHRVHDGSTRRYHRVNTLGHKEKVMEFGKDLWMKFMLPTGHWIYFCAQIKRVKIDAKGTSGGNVTEVLNQARMALDHPILDPDVNRNVLLDHIYIISAAEITRAAQHWMAQHLDKERRRHLIFMDRAEFLTFAARIVADLPVPTTAKPINDDDVPF